MIEVPATITDAARLDYVVEHFWDNLDMTDNGYVDNRNVEQGLVDYLMALRNLPSLDAIHKAVGGFMKKLEAKASPEMYDYFLEIFEKYLYDPNSPYRSEEAYIPVLEAVVANPGLEDIEKVRPRSQLSMALKNRVNEKALDFSYTTEQGRQSSLYGTKADHLLLFFYNLGCPACKDTRLGLIELFKEPFMAELLASGRMKVLAIYPFADMTDWDEYKDEIPSDWINAYDPRNMIEKNELYDLKAIPSLYLLDKDKKVEIKDFVDPQMLRWALGNGQ